MIRIATLLAGALAAAACVTTQGTEAPPPNLKGQPVSAISARLGPPSSQSQVDGRTVYAWRVRTEAPETPVPSTRVSYASGRPNTVDTMSYPDPPRMDSCTLRVVVDAAGTITSTEWQGSNAGCYDAQQKLAGKG